MMFEDEGHPDPREETACTRFATTPAAVRSSESPTTPSATEPYRKFLELKDTVATVSRSMRCLGMRGWDEFRRAQCVCLSQLQAVVWDALHGYARRCSHRKLIPYLMEAALRVKTGQGILQLDYGVLKTQEEREREMRNDGMGAAAAANGRVNDRPLRKAGTNGGGEDDA